MQDSDLAIAHRAKIVQPGAANNGGRMGIEIPSNTLGGMFPTITGAERAAGGVVRAKGFRKLGNSDNKALANARLFLFEYRPGDLHYLLLDSTFDQVEGDLSGSEPLYGCGALNSPALAGASSIDVLSPGADFDVYREGGTLALHNMVAPNDPQGGSIEFVTIAAGGVSYAGDVATLQLDTPLLYSYAVTRDPGDGSSVMTRVSSCITRSELKGAVSQIQVTSAGGGYSSEASIIVNHIAGISQVWSLNFTSATAFTVTGDTLGAVGSGNISSALSPINAAYGFPYFQLPAGFLTGSYSAGDMFRFRTDPAAIPYWQVLDIDTGAAAIDSSAFLPVLVGFSV